MTDKEKPQIVIEWEEHTKNGEKVLVVFLRHLGCTFCMEALADLREQLSEIELRNTRLYIVHMANEDVGQVHLEQYGLDNVSHISDPKRELYKYFELKFGSPLQLFGPQVWLRGLQAFIEGGHLVGKLTGHGFQMPGVALCKDGECSLVYRHPHAGARPDYVSLCAQ